MASLRSFTVASVIALAALAACSDDSDSSGSSNGGAGPTTTTTTTTASGGQGGMTSAQGGGGSGGMPLTCTEEYTNITGECDLLSQQPCGPGYWCDVVGNGTGTACVVDTGAVVGAGKECANNSVCKAGLFCVSDKCTPFCCPANNEPCGGGLCDINVNFGDGYAMMCSYAESCTLFEDTCPPGFDCHIADSDTGLAVCDEPSDNQVDEGGPCQYRNDCKESATCQGSVCRQLCDVTAPAGQMAPLGGCPPDRTCMAAPAGGFPNLGICLP